MICYALTLRLAAKLFASLRSFPRRKRFGSLYANRSIKTVLFCHSLTAIKYRPTILQDSMHSQLTSDHPCRDAEDTPRRRSSTVYVSELPPNL